MSNRSPTGRRVFVSNLGYHDYSPAKRYGDLVPCTSGNIDLKHTDRIEAEIQSVIDTSNSEDYLLVSGHPLTVFLATGYWFRMHGRARLLYWDPLLGDYHLRECNFARREDLIERLLNDTVER